MSTLDEAMGYLADHARWKFAGQGTGNVAAGKVTIPDNAQMVYVEILAGAATYTGMAPAPFSSARWMIGGYWYSASDYGLCNLNVSNNGKTFQIRYAVFNKTDYSSSATLKVYYQ